MPTVILLCPDARRAGGNSTTLARLSGHLSSLGLEVTAGDVQDSCQLFRDYGLLTSLFVVTIHAYKSACILEGLPSNAKLMLIFGGTDLNENGKNEMERNIMKRVVERAQCCVAFSHDQKKLACILWPEHAGKVKVIHQGVITSPNPNFNLRSYLESEHSYRAKDYIILLVAGLRPVKDPLYLMKAYADSPLSETTSFVIVGPVVDDKYAQVFMQTVSNLRESNILYAGQLSVENAHAAIAQSLCVVNSSLSEGMAASILEAFQLGVPVLARDIPGNSYLVKHDETGLLYSTPQEFLRHLEKLLNSSDQRERLVTNAKAGLGRFSSTQERELYKYLINRM
ncbi:glycosyltransferase 1 domain-containing protein 1-like [Watersipora subatra]|uniref:glycosyltransferase 1 domain-containing protein 1-like n=1 Tax=Watersipora subatra TaxID=2589382 RepID=UPI00355AD9E1